jgi:hypothetical protein
MSEKTYIRPSTTFAIMMEAPGGAVEQLGLEANLVGVKDLGRDRRLGLIRLALPLLSLFVGVRLKTARTPPEQFR